MAKPNLASYRFSNQVGSQVPISGLFVLKFDTLVDIVSGFITFIAVDSSGNPDIAYNVSTSATIVDYRLTPTDTENNASYISISYSGLFDKCQYALRVDAGIVKSRDDEIPSNGIWTTTDSVGATVYTILAVGNADLSSNVPASIAFDVSTSPYVSVQDNVILLDLSTINLSPYTKYRLKFDDGAILSTTGETLLYDNFPEYSFITGA